MNEEQVRLATHLLDRHRQLVGGINRLSQKPTTEDFYTTVSMKEMSPRRFEYGCEQPRSISNDFTVHVNVTAGAAIIILQKELEHVLSELEKLDVKT